MRPEYKRFCIGDHNFSDKTGKNEGFFLFLGYRKLFRPEKPVSRYPEMAFYGTGPHPAWAIFKWFCNTK